MKNALVTGAGGFIGRHLIEHLLREGVTVTAVVRNDGDLAELRNDRFHVVCCPLERIDQLKMLLKKEEHFDVIFHLAWAGTTGNDRADYRQQCDSVRFTLDIVDMAGELGIKRFIGAGSLAEYDNLKYLPVDGVVPKAVALYGAAKISAHFMSKIECNRLGMEHIWGVFSNIYGVGNKTNNFVNFAAKLMLTGKRAAFTSGEQYYDFVYIDDFINGLYLMGEYGKNNYEYFIGSGCPRRLKEYIYIIRDTIDKNIELYLGEIPFNGISLQLEQFSTEKLQHDTGYKSTINFEDGIQRTVKWLAENKQDY